MSELVSATEGRDRAGLAGLDVKAQPDSRTSTDRMSREAFISILEYLKGGSLRKKQ
jgi:hypothetical protein